MQPAYLPYLLDAGYAVQVVEPGHRCLARADPSDPAVNLHIYAERAEAKEDVIREIIRHASVVRHGAS